MKMYDGTGARAGLVKRAVQEQFFRRRIAA